MGWGGGARQPLRAGEANSSPPFLTDPQCNSSHFYLHLGAKHKYFRKCRQRRLHGRLGGHCCGSEQRQGAAPLLSSAHTPSLLASCQASQLQCRPAHAFPLHPASQIVTLPSWHADLRVRPIVRSIWPALEICDLGEMSGGYGKQCLPWSTAQRTTAGCAACCCCWLWRATLAALCRDRDHLNVWA